MACQIISDLVYILSIVRTPPAKREKPVRWMGSSKSDLLSFPADVIGDMGYALGLAQLGGKHPAVKP